MDPLPPARTRVLVAAAPESGPQELYKRLQSEGCGAVWTAGDAASALTLAAEIDPHLAILDLDLGGAGGGIGLARQLRAARDLTVVFAAAHPDEATLAAAVAAVPSAIVTRPFDELALRLAVSIAQERADSDRARRDAESRWARADSVLTAVLDGTPDAVLALDEAGHIVLFNAGAQTMFGWRRAEILGQRLDVLLPESAVGVHGVLVDTYRASADQARPMTGRRSVRARRRDGSTFPIDVALGKAKTPGETLVTAMVRDTTERERLTEELMSSQKMDAVGRLAESVAHDFNNLLTIILGAAQILSHPGLPPDMAEEAIRDVTDAGTRGAALVTRLLAFSRPAAGRASIVELDPAVRNAAPLLERLLPHGVRIRLDLDARGAWVPYDATSLDQVLFNLASNAREAMPSGGEIVLTTRLLEGGARARLDVRDTGVGIGPDALPLLFEPYYTTRPGGHGGLGLATVSRLIARGGGTITATSELGEGSTFRLDLPTVEGASPPSRPAPVTRAPVRRALIVASTPGEGEALGALLLHRGHPVVVERGAPAALRRAAEGIDVYDLAFIDTRLTPPPGDDLATAFRRALPSARVIGVGPTAAEDEPWSGRLTHPVDPAHLDALLHEFNAEDAPTDRRPVPPPARGRRGG